MAYAPGVAAAIRQWWAEQKATRQMQALQRQAQTWAEPAGKVAWDEDPEAAAKLLAGPGYWAVQVPTSVRVNYPELGGWPRSAGARPPAFAAPLFRNFPVVQNSVIARTGQYGLVYLHGMKTPSGEERLVYVVVEGDMRSPRTWFAPGQKPAPGAQSTETQALEGSVSKTLRLVAVPSRPAEGSKHPRILDEEAAVLEILPNSATEWMVPFHRDAPSGGKPAPVVLDPRDRFRFYAGQPDPADPGHFTIDYELDGVKGKIHGRLNNDGAVELKPEGGSVSGQVWDPRK
jgi:hypothetical protein